MRTLFHFAFNVLDLDQARAFYGGLLGCKEGRSTDTWVDYNFFGHQLSLHIGPPFKTEKTGQVGGHMVPMPHFGVILPMHAWNDMAKKLTSAGVAFLLKPQVRFKGETGEQSTMFFNDPFGNPIEIKGFDDFAGVHTA